MKDSTRFYEAIRYYNNDSSITVRQYDTIEQGLVAMNLNLGVNLISNITVHVTSKEQIVEKKAPFTFVDIGGGYGQELKAFMKRCPDVVGRFVLQDVSALEIQNAFWDDTASPYCQKIERMAHNFFNGQPIQGAEVYLLARILHDWPDVQAGQILSHIRAAMSTNSVLFVFERVFPDDLEKTSIGDVVNDATMMAIFASLERSESQFKALLDSAGLKLVHAWRRHVAEDDVQAVLEITRNV